nr:neutral zinc metallopeptidase [Antrihabitans stalagmiti]
MRINSTFSRVLVVCATLVLTVGACGGKDADTSSGSASSSTSAGSEAPEVKDVTIDGDLDNPVNELAAKAISDLQNYWAAEYPDLYGEAYRPVEGGFYGVIPSSGKLPPCAGSADDIAGNAYYCPSKDVIAWDAEGLLPNLRERFGDFVVPIVLAHEWGHAIQARSNFEGLTVTSEIQADCFAGVWAAHAIDDGGYDVNAAELDSALAGFLVLRDEPGTDSESENAHGSGFDRVNAFQNGFDDGATECKAYKDGTPAVVELPFNNAADAASGGNAPYDQIINGVPYDWRTTGRSCFRNFSRRPGPP